MFDIRNTSPQGLSLSEAIFRFIVRLTCHFVPYRPPGRGAVYPSILYAPPYALSEHMGPGI